MSTNDERRKAKCLISPAFNGDLSIFTNFEIIECEADEIHRFAYNQIGDVPSTLGENTFFITTQILNIPGIESVTVSRIQITLRKFVPEEWEDLKKGVFDILRMAFPRIEFIGEKDK